MELASCIYEALETAIIAVNPDLPREPPANEGSSIAAYWFQRPGFSIIESALWTIVVLPIAIKYLKQWPQWTVLQKAVANPGVCGPLLAIFETSLRLASWVTMAFIVAYKYQDNRLPFLLQPCHLVNLMLVVLPLLPERTLRQQSIIFNLAIHSSWYGCIIAILTPDLRGQNMWLERETFFIQHGVLVLLPVLWMWQRRFTVWTGSAATLAAWGVFILLHTTVFFAASVYWGANIQYLLMPLRGPVRLLGTWYKTGTLFFCLVMTILTCCVVVPAVVRLGRIVNPPVVDVSAKTAEAAPSAVASSESAASSASTEAAAASEALQDDEPEAPHTRTLRQRMPTTPTTPAADSGSSRRRPGTSTTPSRRSRSRTPSKASRSRSRSRSRR